MTIPPAIAARAKAIAAAVSTAVVTYIGEAIIHGTPWDVHGVELAAIGAVLVGLGVHQIPNAKPRQIIQRVAHLPEKPVTGKRLGRHVRHDPRSRNFAVTPQPLDTLKSVRHHRHVPVFDQGQVGSCTGNACAGALSTAPFRHRFSEHTAVEIYSAAETIDGDGPYPPNDNGSSGLSVAQVALNKKWISRYDHCFNLPAVLTALQTGPVLLGVSWLSGFDNPSKTGQMKVTGSVRGGHEICADEIDVENQRVWITNSWSSAWGISGRAWWTWADLAKVLADQGDATVLVP